MDKTELLALMRLLAALESWAFSQKNHLPDYLYDDLQVLQERVQEELLK